MSAQLVETCGCGASLNVDVAYRAMAVDFREAHEACRVPIKLPALSALDHLRQAIDQCHCAANKIEDSDDRDTLRRIQSTLDEIGYRSSGEENWIGW